jgi:ADP-ribose pyrophosphatase
VWVRRPGNQKAVVIAALHENGKLVVIEEYRVPIEGYELGFPAGLIDDGEDPAEAVRRELLEETGLKLEEVIMISPAVISSAGLSNESVHLAYVKVSGEPNKDKLEASEDITTYLMDQDDVKHAMFGGIPDKFSSYSIGKFAYSVMRNFVEHGTI